MTSVPSSTGLGACEGIGIEDAISEFSPRFPGESQNPFLRYTEAMTSWQHLRTRVRGTMGSRPFAGEAMERMAEKYIHTL